MKISLINPVSQKNSPSLHHLAIFRIHLEHLKTLIILFFLELDSNWPPRDILTLQLEEYSTGQGVSLII